MRALVTGATGFLGSCLVRHLLRSGDEVSIVLRTGSTCLRIADVIAQVRVLDVGSAGCSGLNTWARTARLDTVFHLAWAGAHGAERDRAEHLDRNVRDVLDLLDVAAATGCTSFVGLGSQAEYGPHQERIDEGTPTTPVTPYGVGKLAAGWLISSIAPERGMRPAWLRLFSSYGPGDNAGYLIPYLIEELRNGRPPRVSAGTQLHDTLYCDDVATALRAAAVDSRCRGRYVLASGEAVSVLEIAETVRALVAPRIPIEYGPPAGHPGWLGSHARLTEDTGWSPSVTLTCGLRRTVLWFREHVELAPVAACNPRSGLSSR